VASATLVPAPPNNAGWVPASAATLALTRLSPPGFRPPGGPPPPPPPSSRRRSLEATDGDNVTGDPTIQRIIDNLPSCEEEGKECLK
jgi:hypothetical protein